MKVQIKLNGCDDTTVITKEITMKQFLFLLKKKREHGCYK